MSKGAKVNGPMLQLKGVRRTFFQGDNKLEVLKGIDLAVKPGEIIALVGPSGSGKSTMLQVTGLLETPDEGQVMIAGHDASKLGDRERTLLRRHHLGFVYQYHHLLPEFSAVENIAIPQIIAGTKKSVAKERAVELLQCLGLEARATHRPGKLSGGEQQRVAIARALANVPGLLLADEPTGNLDPETAEGVFNVLMQLARSIDLAAVIATHNPELASRLDRVVKLEDGHLVES